MLTRLRIRNFKRFEDVTIELGNPVVFIGPNNSGKSTALQALTLWKRGMQEWNERFFEDRSSVTLNRLDLVAVPLPVTDLLWHNRSATGTDKTDIVIAVDGILNDVQWSYSLTFRYVNDESIECQPTEQNASIPNGAATSVDYLPPMSGLSDREFLKQPAEVTFLIGQGRTSDVLRNLCIALARESGAKWESVCHRISILFGVELEAPRFAAARAEITLLYRERSGVILDIASAGRGLQQTLMLLAYMNLNPGAVLLLDEPDAHLEILRQRQIYRTLTEVAEQNGSQIIAASHSEVILNEAAGRDTVVAFVGTPHRIDNRATQVLKSLRDIGFEEYYQAEQKGWILYLEGSTDLAILAAFADKLRHTAAEVLSLPFVHYIQNHPRTARDHFHGLREAKPDLVGFLLCDRLDRPLVSTPEFDEAMWSRREIENYLCQPETLTAWAAATDGAPAAAVMMECVRDLVPPIALSDPDDSWWRDTKASDVFLDRLFERYYALRRLPNLMRKSNYHVLAQFVPRQFIAHEVTEKLDRVAAVALRAKPAA